MSAVSFASLEGKLSMVLFHRAVCNGIPPEAGRFNDEQQRTVKRLRIFDW